MVRYTFTVRDFHSLLLAGFTGAQSGHPDHAPLRLQSAVQRDAASRLPKLRLYWPKERRFQLARPLTTIPRRRNSFAVAKASVYAFLCRVVDLGLAIIDDTVERPNQIANLPLRHQEHRLGGNDSILYGEDWNYVY